MRSERSKIMIDLIQSVVILVLVIDWLMDNVEVRK